jgi:hypothetical protein
VFILNVAFFYWGGINRDVADFRRWVSNEAIEFSTI